MTEVEPRGMDDNHIEQFLHCKLCGDEVHSGKTDTGESESMRSYAKYELGWTKWGLQVWCIRHNANIIHIDFDGEKHKAYLSRNPKNTRDGV
tara:strand:+ start:230 stop:505 length:276 start_codon:yes stop_codon:yes gene_type:complete